jgi:prepilin-type N-terminal cleavage/methylation domain-containing protein
MNENARGFTILEVMVVIGMFALFSAVASINLVRPQQQSRIDGTVDGLVADLKQQQLRSMMGDTAGQSSAQAFGVHIETNSYTLFWGSYVAGNVNNSVIQTPGVTLTTNTLPSSQVIFTKKSGEAVDSGGAGLGSQNTVQLTSQGIAKTITINKFGALTVN